MDSKLMQAQNKLLSIIVVTYKQQNYLYQTLESILMQDYARIELIIADDGTPELDVKKIEKYINNNNSGNIIRFLILYDGKNRGTVKNINRALPLVKGQFIKIIGGDDTYFDYRVFSKEIAFLNSHKNLYGAVSKCQQCDAFMKPIKDARVEKSNNAISKVLSMTYDQSRRYITNNDIFPIAVQATIFTRDYYNDVGGCDEDYMVIDDSPTVLKILKNHNRFGFLDIYSVNHRSNIGVSASKEMFSPKRLKYYKDVITYDRKEIKKNPNVYGRKYCRYIPKVNEYIYLMALGKQKNKNKSYFVYATAKYMPALLYYCLHNYKKVTHRFGMNKKNESFNFNNSIQL